MSHLFRILAFLCLSVFVATFSHAIDLDNVVTLVKKSDYTSDTSKNIGSFAYDTNKKEIYVTAYQAGNPGVMRFSGVGLSATVPGTLTPELMVTETELQLFYRNNDPNRGVSNPSISGFLLNPKAVGGNPAYSFAVMADLGLTKVSGGTANDPAATKRIFSYNLGQGNQAGGAFTSYATISQLNTVAGAVATNTTTNTGRQMAWSSDGQSFYFLDSSAPLGGVWKMPALGGTPQRIFSSTTVSSSEIGVLPSAQGDVIFIGGNAASGNTGGIDKIVDNGTIPSAASVHIAGSVISNFFEYTGTQTATIVGFATDSAGNLYFNNTANYAGTPDRRGIYRLDPNNRISKVMEQAEKTEDTTGTHGSANRMQVRDVNYTGANGTFTVPQVMFTDSSLGAVLGANAFKPGDFNRDNQLSAADINLFRQINPQTGIPSSNLLTTRGVLMSLNPANALNFTAADYKFDMNGNTIFDWKDLKVMQPFFDFGDGDINLNGVVDFGDFQILQNNFLGTGKTWLGGDLDGNDVVNFADFQILQNSFGYQSSVLTGANLVAFDQGQWNSFIAAIPEPSTYAALGCVVVIGLALQRRRKNQVVGCNGTAA